MSFLASMPIYCGISLQTLVPLLLHMVQTFILNFPGKTNADWLFIIDIVASIPGFFYLTVSSLLAWFYISISIIEDLLISNGNDVMA